MPDKPQSKPHYLVGTGRYLLRWTPIAVVVGVFAGSASALLLWSLDLATAVREAHVWLIALLPVAGFAVGLLYWRFGTAVEKGNNLILDEIHSPQRTIPIRMTPLILLGTFLTHLFGGSAGREGTALQTGASLADQLARPLKMGTIERRVLLMAGLSAGFGSVFGTPLAGAVFGMEVLAVGAVSYDAIFPCFVAAFIGDLTTRAWHVHHTVYAVTEVPAMGVKPLVLACVAGAAFGLAALLFARLTHAIGGLFKRYIRWAPLRPLIGGAIVALAVYALGSTRYIGLGVPEIVGAFHGPLRPWDWAGKLLFTAVTLGAGFKGGEVTPLFFIGATLGNALSHILPLPATLLAGMGFAAVFAGAANTPIASAMLAMELFGSEAGAYAAVACVLAYLFSGESGIYGSQRAGSGKLMRTADAQENLAERAKTDDFAER